ncbi:MAG TPA: hypothetical protein VND89_07875 [Acidimicrobiales bacterium]|nr:hypothetical protein [Acidimicrobiales bacterium]
MAQSGSNYEGADQYSDGNPEVRQHRSDKPDEPRPGSEDDDGEDYQRGAPSDDLDDPKSPPHGVGPE